MADRRRALREAGRSVPFLALALVAGFLLGACGGGNPSAVTRTGQTVTRPAVTATRPAAAPTTAPAETATSPATTAEEPVAITTREITTVEVEVTTTAEAPTTATPTVTVTEPAETETQPEPAPVPTAPTTTATTVESTTGTAETTSSTSSAWGWIALLGAALLALIAIVVWRRGRGASSSWSSEIADLARRSLVTLDDVLAEGSVVTGRVEALAGEARSLEGRAPDDRSRAAAGRLREHLDGLAAALETDRRLRLGSPPPSDEQLAYSTRVIREQALQVQTLLTSARGDPGGAAPSPGLGG